MTNKNDLIYSEFSYLLKIIWKQINDNQIFELFNNLKKQDESVVTRDKFMQNAIFISSKLVDFVIIKLEA